MKAFYAVIFVYLSLCLYGCKKDSISDPGSVVGKWSIVNIATDTGVGFSNHTENYTGQRADFFEFTANGTLYTKKGNVVTTLNYTMLADTSIIINTPGNTSYTPQPGRITTFTAHSLVIYGPYLLTPGGIFGSTITLSR